MKTVSRRALMVALAILWVWLSPLPVRADSPGPQVDGFDVEQVAQLSPGTPLLFSVYGTPGATASLQIAGAIQALPLQEIQSGVYEGRYVIGARDRIAPDSRVTATIWAAGRATTVVLEEPLVLGAEPMPVCSN